MTKEQRDEIERLKEKLNRVGNELSVEEWIEMCDDLADYYQTSAAAARETAGL